MQQFEGSVAIVAGASSGVGRATAQMLADRGARVVLAARSRAALEEASRGSDRMRAVACDVADEQAVEALFSACEAHFGTCDLLVNAAAIIDPAPLVDTPPARWDAMFDINVKGTYLTCRRALPAMLASGRGSIVNVSSISGIPGPPKFPGWVSYCASKGAVISMTEALATEIATSGVRVNCVSPGSVDTPMWAAASGGAPAAMSADEVAESILFLASDASRPMNGQNLCLYTTAS